jgi:hypothetical protein
VNTLFGCLATTSEQYSFAPVWRPPFLSKLAAKTAATLTAWRWRTEDRAT